MADIGEEFIVHEECEVYSDEDFESDSAASVADEDSDDGVNTLSIIPPSRKTDTGTYSSRSSSSGTPLSELKVSKCPIRYRLGERIGSGSYGVVYKGYDLDHAGRIIAVKELEVDRRGRLEKIQREIDISSKLHHPNIVQYLGTNVDVAQGKLSILMEYVQCGSLLDLLNKFHQMHESLVQLYTRQIVLGIEYIHKNRIIHRDLKCANILVRRDGLVKLADFGASTELNQSMSVEDLQKTCVGTPYWMAPEVISGAGHGRAADIWSLGCTVLEMLTGEAPWSHLNVTGYAALVVIATTEDTPRIPTHVSPEASSFLSACLTRDPSKRAKASDLLSHPFIRNTFVPDFEENEAYNATTMSTKSSVASGLARAAGMGSVQSSVDVVNDGSGSSGNALHATPRLSSNVLGGTPQHILDDDDDALCYETMDDRPYYPDDVDGHYKAGAGLGDTIGADARDLSADVAAQQSEIGHFIEEIRVNDHDDREIRPANRGDLDHESNYAYELALLQKEFQEALCEVYMKYLEDGLDMSASPRFDSKINSLAKKLMGKNLSSKLNINSSVAVDDDMRPLNAAATGFGHRRSLSTASDSKQIVTKASIMDVQKRFEEDLKKVDKNFQTKRKHLAQKLEEENFKMMMARESQ